MASFLATQILHPKHSCCPQTGSLNSGPSAPGVLLPWCAGEGAGGVALEQNTRNMERTCLVCIFILVNLLEMLNTVWGAHGVVKVWKKTSLSVTWGLALLCPWTCHDFHPLPWRKECSMSKKVILSVQYNFWSPLLSKEVCPAPHLEHTVWQQCWLLSPSSPEWPTVPAAFWAVLLCFFPVSFCVQNTLKWVTVA